MPLIESMLGIPTVSLAGTSASSHCVSTATTASMASAATMSSAATLTMVSAGTHANASMFCNLLPSLGQSKEMSLSTGIYVGEGLLPVPAKLAEKITQWEFVEMAELLPEFWSSLASREPGANLAPQQSASRRKRAVMDIATWIQCFAMYTSVMSTPHPQAVPHPQVAWVTYDAAFRRQALITGNRQWSKVNPSLYSICFSGADRTGVRCELCLSLSHLTRECTLVCDPDQDVSTRLKTLESAVLAFTSHTPLQQGLPLHAKPSDVCRNWNARNAACLNAASDMHA